jgi:hypothetical protein
MGVLVLVVIRISKRKMKTLAFGVKIYIPKKEREKDRI